MKKTEIKRILIPLDFSATAQLALEQGAFMASLLKADLYLLHIVEAMEFVYTLYDPITVMSIDTSEIEKSAKRNLDNQAEKIKKTYGIHVITLVGRGRVVAELNEIAIDHKIDLIVMGTHGTKGFQEFFLGSNAHKIITLSPCPIITFQSEQKKLGFRNIILPIDNSLHSRQKVDYVIEIATHYGAFVHLLGLVNTDEDIDENKFMIKIESVQSALENAKIEYDRKIVHGKNLAIEAIKYSNEVKADLIVTMTDHESDLTGMFLGAFAKQIVNHSRIPVMSIKPIEAHYETLDATIGSTPF